jgi:hypothetical protein
MKDTRIFAAMPAPVAALFVVRRTLVASAGDEDDASILRSVSVRGTDLSLSDQ